MGKGNTERRVAGLVAGLKGDPELEHELSGYRYLPPAEAEYADLEMDPRVRDVLAERGIERLFAHQAEAVSAVRRGEDVVAMTPTASGKSLVYNLPVMEAALAEPGARALYVFPLKGLERDQVGGLNDLLDALELRPEPRPRERAPLAGAEVYDGDTPGHRRRKIRAHPPTALFTNPDMLHLALLPHHGRWAELFANLRYVVIDEIHTYRGIFGSHAAQVFRRLRRVARYHGADPQFIACSATIANPGELAGNLVGRPFTSVTANGAPSGGKHFYLVNPEASPNASATNLFLRCLGSGLKAIAFTRARRATELVHQWAAERAPELATRISPYRAGFLPGERREIEARLFRGELDGVVSTSALELGVDIGGLDACVLVGYPGSMASTWQRAGRAGRRGNDAVVFLVAQRDALDQYFMRHPEAFFGGQAEAAVVDPSNPRLLAQHLPCAGSEVPLGEGEPELPEPACREVRAELVAKGFLQSGADGGLVPWRGSPHAQVGIRSIGAAFALLDAGGRRLGELNGDRVLYEAFPGAIYLHRGWTYRIRELDLEGRRAVAEAARVSYHTRALSREETAIRSEHRRRRGRRLTARWGELRITREVTGFERRRNRDGRRIDRKSLDLPPTTFDTEGLWLTVSGAARDAVTGSSHDLAGGLHAAEHALIKLLPLFALCDKQDVGGVSYPLYPPLDAPAIFVYDGYEGGVGFTRRGIEVLGDWMATTLDALRACPCEAGCPACVQDPQCGNANEPLDKDGAIVLLAHWLAQREGESRGSAAVSG